MNKFFNLMQANLWIGLLIILSILQSCSEKQNKHAIDIGNRNYIYPVDSIGFNYQSQSWKGDKKGCMDDRFGRKMIYKNNQFCYVSITSNNEFHTFDFITNTHTYSKQICEYSIDAYLIEDSLVYLLYNNTLFIKDFQLNTIDSFKYEVPNIVQKHGIDFSIENNSNLFKVGDYFALMYYIVDKQGRYRNSKFLFNYFNKSTSFFANKMCNELDTSFQYFRYPAITSDGAFLYYASRVLNCISKSNDKKNVIHKAIEKGSNNYLALSYGDQFQISKLKKYRFSTDYNKDIIVADGDVFLLKEFPNRIFTKNNVKKYDLDLKLIKFDKFLKRAKTFYIKDNGYSFSFITRNKLYLFNFQKNKYYVYEI